MGVAYIIAFGLADIVGWRKAWHAIIALGGETRSNDVERGMPSPPWDNTHGQTTSGVACYHRLWAAQTVIRRRPWHAITALGQHTWSDDFGRGMPSPPLDSTHGPTTSGMECHHLPWTAHTVGQRQALHDITTLGRHARSGDVGRGMTSLPLDNTHSGTTSGVACHRCLRTR